MIKDVKKKDLRLISTEIYINNNNKITISNLNDFIENIEIYKNKLHFETQIANIIIENREHEEIKQFDLEEKKL